MTHMAQFNYATTSFDEYMRWKSETRESFRQIHLSYEVITSFSLFKED